MSTKTDNESRAYIITGADAIRIAKRDHITLRKFADPTEGEREGLTVEEAEEIAWEDPSLIHICACPIGWNAKTGTEGYCFGDYWTRSGHYYGPDSEGVEPVFAEC